MRAPLPPDTPADVSLFYENEKYVFRVDESKAIYVYDGDKAGTPTCVDECSRRWPPVIASRNSQAVGDWTLVERPDHAKQWRYRDRPVYTNVNDPAGQASADGVDGVWHVVVP